MSEVLSIGAIHVALRRSDRRQTIGLTVERDGSVIASVPTKTTADEVSRVLRSRELWIHAALARRVTLTPSLPTKEYVAGEGFFYLGRSFRLRVVNYHDASAGAPEVRLFRGKFELRKDCVPNGRECFVRWYTKQAEVWLSEHVPQLAKRVGPEVRHVAVMDLGFRWGSCSDTGRLNFHWRTILLPPAIVTYLVLHEICHVLEHNHSDRFWSLIRRVDQEYETKERWLKSNGARFFL